MIRPGRMVQEVLKSIGRKPDTVRYPAVKTKMPDKFRGTVVFDADKCIGCKMCMRDCPSGAINVRKVGEKKFEIDLDISRCIVCGLCVDVCPKDAIEATDNFEQAQLTRGKLRVTFRGKPETDPEKKA
jgi:formate hydrogenlyase subunit 6/NADH:ubiquinone oxidoreductase subunit I